MEDELKRNEGVATGVGAGTSSTSASSQQKTAQSNVELMKNIYAGMYSHVNDTLHKLYTHLHQQ